MTLHELETVVLERDLPNHGLQRGDMGTIVMVYGSGAVEVEFIRASGFTQAVIELESSDIRLAGDDDILAVRHVDHKPGSV